MLFIVGWVKPFRLWRLRTGEATVVVAPVRALVQRLGPHVEDVEPIAVAPGQQVDPDDLNVMAHLVPGAETHRVPGLTHVLRRTDGPGSVFAYRKLLRQPVDADLLTGIARWLTTHLR